MLTDIYRSFFIFFSQLFFPLLAALLLLREDIQKNWTRVFYTSFFSALLGLFTILFFKITDFITFFNILFVIIFIKIFFKIKWFDVFKFVITQQIFVFSFTATGRMLAVYLYNVPTSEAFLDTSLMLKIFLPLYILTIPVALAIRPLTHPLRTLLTKVEIHGKHSTYYTLMLAIILQFFLVMIIFAESMGSGPSKFINIPYINIFLSISLFISIIFVFLKSTELTEKRVLAQSQEAVTNNVMNLINTARNQKYDFINHIEVINSLVENDKEDELKEYVSKLTESVSFYNTLLNINEPIISAFLNSKMAWAEAKKIRFEINIEADLSRLSSLAYEVIRVLGNLIDNALDEVSRQNEKDQWVKLVIEEKGPLLIFSVTNPGSITEKVKKHMYTPGFTTKDECHSGLGLYICQELAAKMHGKIYCSPSNEGNITFSFILPKP